MIAIQAHGWHQFLAAFGVLRNAGVEPVASGGNAMRVPDDTCRDVLRAVAATGADVHADLTEPVTAEPDDAPVKAETEPVTPDTEEALAAQEPETDETVPVQPAPARKATRPRTRKTKE